MIRGDTSETPDPAGPVYALVAFIMGAGFLLLARRVWRERDDLAARRLFGYSILYLFVLFATLIAERLPALAVGLWSGIPG